MSNGMNEQRLTAYALGELDGEDRAAVESHLAEHEESRRFVEEIRATARLLSEELKIEPQPGLSEKHRRAIKARLNSRPLKMRPAGRFASLPWLPVVAAGIIVVAGWYAFLAIQDRANRPPRADAISDSGVTVQLKDKGETKADMEQIRNREGSQFANSRVVISEKRLGYTTPDIQDEISEPEAAEGLMGEGRSSAALEELENERAMPSSPAADGSSGSFSGLPTEKEKVGESRKVLLSGWAEDQAEAYDRIVDNSFLQVTQNPLSTFSIDVDTASYANIRRFLTQNKLPPKDSVRIEEMVNYFPYSYSPPTDEHPFSAHVEVAECPWARQHRLARVGLKGREIARDQRPPSNLVFLIDVSGSMSDANKLPLVKSAMNLLVSELTGNDRLAIVVYAGASGLMLPSTSCDKKEAILSTLERLSAGGSTNGGGGIQMAYDVAASSFIKGGVNRVILATDGDFNVGITSQGDLIRLIEEKAKSGVFLSVLGFGMGNYKDSTLENLADKGNGNYAYVDTFEEARKVLGEQMCGTLVTIAKDVKIQIEFNPAQAAAYRLVGYENRVLRKEDFNDDNIDAGEIGAGHSVTALYEIVPAGKEIDCPPVDGLKNQQPPSLSPAPNSKELLTLKLRYKEPGDDTSKFLEFPVTDGGASYSQASEDFKFAASVAAFGMILRDSPHKGTSSLAGVLELAEEGQGADKGGYRGEFLSLVKKTLALQTKAGKF